MKLTKTVVITIFAAVMLTSFILLAQVLMRTHETKINLNDSQFEEEVQNNMSVPVSESTNALIDKPLIDSNTGKLLLPLRYIIEKMGGTVIWDKNFDITEISCSGVEVKIQENNKYGSVNGQSIVMSDIPKRINNSLYVSSDFISMNFGVVINWNEESEQITITKNSEKLPIVNANALEYTSENISYYIEVPVLIGLNDKAFEDNINKTLIQNETNLVQNFVSTVTNLAVENENYWYQLKMSVSYRTPKIISIVMNGERKLPNEEMSVVKSTITINLENQNFISLKDIFKGESYESVILQEMEKFKEKDSLLYDAGLIKTVNPQDFYIKENNLVVFVRSQYANEYVEYEIPFEDISKNLRSEYKNTFIK